MVNPSSGFKSHLVHFLSPSPKQKSNLPRKKFLTFQETELFYSDIKKILTFSQRKAFLIFSEIFSYISENETPHFLIPSPKNKKVALVLKKFLYFGKRNPALFSPRSKNKNIDTEKISYTSGNENPEKSSYIFLKESYSYISGIGNPEKVPYFSRNFFYFRKCIFRTLSYLELGAYSKP